MPPMDADNASPDSMPTTSGNYQISPRLVAAASGIVSIAAITTLVIVVAVKGADELASIALVLAILAFVIQIVVFIVDSFSSSQRDREANKVYAGMREVLARIEEKTSTTNEVLGSQYQSMIQYLASNLRGQASESADPASKSAFAEVARFLERTQEGPVSSTAPVASVPATPRAQRVRRLYKWPVKPTIDRLVRDGADSLSAEARDIIGQLAVDIEVSEAYGDDEGKAFPDLRADVKNELLALNFVREHDSRLRIATRGFPLAQVLTAFGPTPDYVTSALPWVADERAKQRERASELDLIAEMSEPSP